MHFLFDGRVIQDHFPGIGRYAYNLLRAMREHLRPDESLRVIAPAAPGNTRHDLTRLAHPRLTLIAADARVFSPATALGRLPGRDAAVAHFPYYVRPYVWPAPSVTTIYDLIPLLHPETLGSARARLTVRGLLALAVRASTAILTISRWASDDLLRFFPSAAGKVTVTPLAHDPALRPAPEADIARARATYGLPPRFALYLASNKPHKNLVRLVEAWALVVAEQGAPDHVPDLVIAGHQDPRFTDAPDRAAALGIGRRVRFIGAVPDADLPALYTACTLFVYPSLYEGFGLTPLEAMACGAPVACSNAASLAEVTGEAALQFDPASPRAIADACARALGDPALLRDLAARSLRRAAAFSWDAAASATIAVYRSVARP